MSYDTLFVDAVVAAGVDVNAKTIYGRTAADFVFGMEKTDTAATALKDYDGKNGGASNLLYALMKNGANVNLEYALNMAEKNISSVIELTKSDLHMISSITSL